MIKQLKSIGLILKVVEFCNLSCEFCGYAQHKSTLEQPMMSFDLFKKAVIKTCEHNIKCGDKSLSIVYHGGEPLLWGLDNFKKALTFEKYIEHKYPGFRFYNYIQTNGKLISEEWTSFFIEENINVGVSIDGPEQLNGHCDGNQTDVIAHLKQLTQLGCETRVLSVITEDHEGQADSYYEYMRDNGIFNIGLCFCIAPENNSGIDNQILIPFLKRLYDRCKMDGFIMHIREFEAIIQANKGKTTPYCTFNQRKNCGRYFTIRSNGDVIFCDPIGFEEDALGNISSDDISDFLESSILTKILYKSKISLSSVCEKCDINSLCGKGCTKYLDNNGKNYFCDTYKYMYTYINNNMP